MAKKILIIGFAGFIGSNIFRRLKEKHAVIGIDDLSFGNLKNIESNYGWSVSCISKLEKSFLDTFDMIISSYCSNIIYAMDNGIVTYENNIINGMKCFSKFKGKIIYLSTSSVYGNPTKIPTPENYSGELYGAYAISKYVMEEYLKIRGNYTTLRLSNVYGPNQRPDNPYCGVVNKFIYNKLKGIKSPIHSTVRSSRDYTYVCDVVDAIERCVGLPALETEINIGTSIETTMKKLVYIIGCDYEIVEAREIDNITRRRLNIDKAKKLLDWQPETSLDEGIKKTEEWIKKEYSL